MLGSLRARLLVVWAASLAACAVMGVLFVQLYVDSTTATAARAGIAGLRACDRLADRFAFYATGWDPPASQQLDDPTRRGLLAVAQAAIGFSGMSIGFWREGEGVVAATPLPPPAAEIATLRAAAEESLGDDAPARREIGGDGGVLLLACPLRGPLRDLVGWVRVVIGDTPALDRLRLGLGVLLALVLGISAWLTWLLRDWNRRLGAVEAALAADGAAPLPVTGLLELDRLVVALQTAKTRLAAARDRAAANERLAALGRVAAGVAHEIRNPVAAMRLRAENALAADPLGRGAALEAILGQLRRLDRLIAELLEMTQRREPRPRAVRLEEFLRRQAEEAGVPRMEIASGLETAVFDPAMVGRIVLILLDNAARHAPGAAARVGAWREADRLVIEVADDGPGVPPAIRASLFEPFVTGRPDGTGLGLAIARELARAQGGEARLVPGETGATFRLELPWQAS
jgi:signal transduction histidine kinase